MKYMNTVKKMEVNTKRSGRSAATSYGQGGQSRGQHEGQLLPLMVLTLKQKQQQKKPLQ